MDKLKKRSFQSIFSTWMIICIVFLLSTVSLRAQHNKKLIIKGNNIWVRDQPGTGKVVLKLNDGDSCKFDYPRQFEIIRGTPHYWYPIQYKGQYGYVFGSQTNQEFTGKPISSARPTELWVKFKRYYKEEAKKQKEEWDDFDYELEDNGDSFQYEFEAEGYSAFHYKLDTVLDKKMIIITQAGKIPGAAGYSNVFESYVGLYKEGFYELFPSERQGFNGLHKYIIKISETEYLMASYYDSGDGIVVFRDKYFEIYYINTENQTIRLIANQLGHAIEGMHLQNVSKDSIFNTQVEMKYQNGDSHFKLIEYRAIKTDENVGFEPYDILETKYKWDARKFTLKKVSD